MMMIFLLYVSDLLYFQPGEYYSGLNLPLAILLLFGLCLFIIRHFRKKRVKNYNLDSL